MGSHRSRRFRLILTPLLSIITAASAHAARFDKADAPAAALSKASIAAEDSESAGLILLALLDAAQTEQIEFHFKDSNSIDARFESAQFVARLLPLTESCPETAVSHAPASPAISQQAAGEVIELAGEFFRVVSRDGQSHVEPLEREIAAGIFPTQDAVREEVLAIRDWRIADEAPAASYANDAEFESFLANLRAPAAESLAERENPWCWARHQDRCCSASALADSGCGESAVARLTPSSRTRVSQRLFI